MIAEAVWVLYVICNLLKETEAELRARLNQYEGNHDKDRTRRTIRS